MQQMMRGRKHTRHCMKAACMQSLYANNEVTLAQMGSVQSAHSMGVVDNGHKLGLLMLTLGSHYCTVTAASSSQRQEQQKLW